MDSRLMVERAKDGDKEALLSLIMDRKNEYYRLAYVYTGSREDSMDAMEDMIVILYQEIRKLKKSDAFYSWSKTILVNCCKNILRKNNKTVSIEDVEIGFSENSFEKREQRADILRQLRTLNNHQQEAIKLKYLMDMDYESIAKVTGVPVGTVKSRISTGLSKLRKCFGGEY